MFCPECGKGLADDAKFCIQCGKQLISDPRKSPVAPLGVLPINNRILKIVFGVFGALFIGFGLFLPAIGRFSVMILSPVYGLIFLILALVALGLIIAKYSFVPLVIASLFGIFLFLIAVGSFVSHSIFIMALFSLGIGGLQIGFGIMAIGDILLIIGSAYPDK